MEGAGSSAFSTQMATSYLESDGEGRGPGEFENPVLVPTWATDSLLVGIRIFVDFKSFQTTARIPGPFSLTKKWPAGGRPPVGAVGLHMLVRKYEMVVDLRKFRLRDQRSWEQNTFG